MSGKNDSDLAYCNLHTPHSAVCCVCVLTWHAWVSWEINDPLTHYSLSNISANNFS